MTCAKKRIYIAVIFLFGFLLHAQAELTNQTLITPSLRFELLGSPPENTNSFDADEQINFLISSTDDKGHVFALLPFEQTFMFTLHDTNGNIVPKTKLGIQNSQAFDIQKTKDSLKASHPQLTDSQLDNLLAFKLKIKHHPVNPDRPYFNYFIVPQNNFVITNKGIYTLDVQIRAWMQKTNGQYGVVESRPLHVKVIKE